jgi:hypothetical protein
MFSEVTRAVALGSKHGLKALRMYGDATVETPAIDESAMEGAVGIVDFGKFTGFFNQIRRLKPFVSKSGITLAAVIIALYITAIVDHIMSYIPVKVGNAWYLGADLVVCQRPRPGLHIQVSPVEKLKQITFRSLDFLKQNTRSVEHHSHRTGHQRNELILACRYPPDSHYRCRYPGDHHQCVRNEVIPLAT